MKSKLHKYAVWFNAFMLLPLINFAQGTQASSTSTYFSNALFLAMLAVITILLIVIVALTQALKNIGQSDYLLRRDENDKNSGTKIAATLFILFTVFSANAQTHNAKQDWIIGGLDMFTFYFMLGIIVLEGIVLTSLLLTLRKLLESKRTAPIVAKPKEKTILSVLSGAVEIENEAEIMLDHDYDGIKELDNDLPPWWKYGFYLTIVVAFIYMIHFHIAKTGDLQRVEYAKEIEKARVDVAEYMKNAASNVDETSVKMLEGADIEAGKNIFVSTCAACHGKFGEGGVGPNLTDNYWINGGSISSIFKTVKYGWPDKGMKSWKDELSPMQIAQVSSFIKTLKGTNPPNPKAQQGDLFVEEGNAPITDSLSLPNDSLQALIKDTIKTIAPGTKTK